MSFAIVAASSSVRNLVDAEDRPEDLFPGDAHVVGDVGEDGRQNEDAAQPIVLATAQRALGTFAPGDVDVRQDLPVLRLVGDRSHPGIRLHRVALPDLFERATMRSGRASWTLLCTSGREPAMQLCPVVPKIPATAPLAATSRSASSKTTLGDLSPSSSETRMRLRTAAAAITLPVAAGPFDVAVAYAQQRYATSLGLNRAGDKQDTANIGGSYDLGWTKVLGYYQHHKLGNYKESCYSPSVQVPVGQAEIRLGYDYGKLAVSSGGAVSKVDQIKATYPNNQSKRTAMYGTASVLMNKNTAALSVTVGSSITAAPTAGGDSKGVEIGVRHFFWLEARRGTETSLLVSPAK